MFSNSHQASSNVASGKNFSHPFPLLFFCWFSYVLPCYSPPPLPSPQSRLQTSPRSAFNLAVHPLSFDSQVKNWKRFIPPLFCSVSFLRLPSSALIFPIIGSVVFSLAGHHVRSQQELDYEVWIRWRRAEREDNSGAAPLACRIILCQHSTGTKPIRPVEDEVNYCEINTVRSDKN